MIRAVLFDIGGTIHTQDGSEISDQAFAQRLQEYLQAHHVAVPCTQQELLAAVNAGAKRYKAFCEERLCELDGDTIWRDYMLADLNLPAEQLVGLGEDLCYMFDRHKKEIIQRDGLHETLQALQERGYRLGVISNIMSKTFVPRILQEYGVADYFETLVLSSECGIRKPDRRIFDLALEQMHITADEACYIGDTVSRDVRGVKNAGWAMMIQIDNPRIYHKDEKYRSLGLKPEYEIKTLPEIVSILDAERKKTREGAKAI